MKTMAMLLVAVLLSSCATQTAVQRLAESEQEHVYVIWVDQEGRTLVTRNCPFYPIIEGNSVTGWRSPVCTEVAGTRNQADTEFWKFERYHAAQIFAPVPILGFIPTGPSFKGSSTTKIGVIGPQAACEAIRATVRKPRGVAGDDTDSWTEPCQGPYYFRRVEEK